MKKITPELPFIIIGAGGHAQVVIELLQSLGHPIMGIVDSDPVLEGQHVNNIPVLGKDDTILDHDPNSIYLANGIASVKTTTLRAKLFNLFFQKGYAFPPLIHPSSYVAEEVCIHDGVQVMSGAIVQVKTTLEQNALVNTRASVDHECFIGAHSHIAPGCVILGGASIQPQTHIGASSTVVQQRRIGTSVLVGAGSLVLDDISDYATAWGSPARIQPSPNESK